jgi:hypothetical protein
MMINLQAAACLAWWHIASFEEKRIFSVYDRRPRLHVVVAKGR